MASLERLLMKCGTTNPYKTLEAVKQWLSQDRDIKNSQWPLLEAFRQGRKYQIKQFLKELERFWK